ncbi:iron-containing alcohol dehydrogenase [Georgenia deserti]|uniref:iron-containing alcohol dehydrogenase n=1 Tax=Georgenia deserti TaxID=2093781 RepID=UPI0036D7B5A4
MRLSFAAARGPKQVLFGAGQRRAAGWVTAEHGNRALVCADPYLVGGRQLEEIIASLHAEDVRTSLYSDVVPELPVSGVNDAVEAARSFGADVIVAVGGGSSIDLAKLVAVLLRHGSDLTELYGENRVPGPSVPVVALPTTAGTGSEVTPVAVVTDAGRSSKVGVSSRHLIPVAAICDPELSYTCPPAVTASAGADAFSHCVEAYTAVRHAPDPALARDRVFVGRGETTDNLALTGMAHIAAGLQRAHREPTDAAARASVMYGSLMAGLAFGTAGTAAAHALQYPVGALTGTAHGVGVGLLLPYVMAHNLAVRTAEMARIARILAVEEVAPAPAADATEAEFAAAAPSMVAQFLSSVGIPRSLAEIGVEEDRLRWAAAEGPRAARLAENNPIPLTTADAERLLAAAWTGDLSRIQQDPTEVGAR